MNILREQFELARKDWEWFFVSRGAYLVICLGFCLGTIAMFSDPGLQPMRGCNCLCITDHDCMGIDTDRK